LVTLLSSRNRPPRQRPTREETRERVLDAAVQLFFEQGPAAATLDAVAARAGLTKGAIYSSFENKDQLMAAVVERLPTTMYTDVLPPGATSKEGVRRALRSFAEAVTSLAPPEPAIALIHELYALALRNAATRETISVWVAAMVEEAAEGGPPANVNLRVSYKEMWVIGQLLLEGLFLRRAINPELVSDELVAVALELLADLVEE
jgi:AcrR family transcriptional regulator